MKRKNFKRSVFALLAALPLLASCSSGDGQVPAADAALELYAGVGGMPEASRASLYRFENTPVMFANRLDSDPYGDYWNARITIQGYVVFIPQRLYNMDDKNHYLRGFYPVVPLSDITAGVVTYDIDGENDIMVTNETDLQSLNNRPVMPPLVVFSHLLTQFRFNIVNNETTPYRTDRHIKSITISATTDVSGLAQTGLLDLSTGTLGFSDYAQSIVVYDAGAGQGIAVPEAGKPKTDAAVAMFEPGKDMTLEVVYENEAGADITKTVNLDLSAANAVLASQTHPVASYSYGIRLEFKGVAVTVVPTLESWNQGQINGGNTEDINVW